MKKDILWVVAALFVTLLCLVNSYLETSVILKVLWYIGAGVGLIAAAFSGFETLANWRSGRQIPTSTESGAVADSSMDQAKP